MISYYTVPGAKAREYNKEEIYMATNLLNRAQVSYTYSGNAGTAVSNQTNTTLLDEFTMDVTKEALTEEVRAGDTAAYVVRVDNTGAGTLLGITVTDDLGAAAGAPAELTYVEGSVEFYVNGDSVEGTATPDADGITFAVAIPLTPGDNLLVVYLARLSETATVPVTNTATVTANTSSTAAAVVTAQASVTITPTVFADITIFKAADKATVMNGDTLTYTFTLMNTGAEAATGVVFTDAFPAEFTVTSVSYTVGDVTTPVSPADYTITAPNTLTMPAEASTLALTVPAATEAGPGVMTITVTGTIAETTIIE